jgi:hypothetical protein
MKKSSVKTCPFCAEEILADAIKCKHCHEIIKKETDAGKPDEQGKQDEHVVTTVNPVWHEFGWQFLFGLLLIPLFGIGLVVLVHAFIRQYGNKYIVTNKKVVFQEGLFTRHRQVFRIANIASIATEQSFLQRIFGCGRVILSLPGIKFETRKIQHPGKFAAIINKYR